VALKGCDAAEEREGDTEVDREAVMDTVPLAERCEGEGNVLADTLGACVPDAEREKQPVMKGDSEATGDADTSPDSEGECRSSDQRVPQN
jgi:hypothetical protein